MRKATSLKRPVYCCHGNIPESCLECKMDFLRLNPEMKIASGDLLGVINAFLERIDCLSGQIDDLESRLPFEYDPQCE